MSKAPDLSVKDGSSGLKVLGLRKNYKRRPVIRDVSMELARGEVVVVNEKFGVRLTDIVSPMERVQSLA